MADVNCLETMELLSVVFRAPFIFNDGHEILARLEAGDELADIAEDVGRKFGRGDKAHAIRRVVESWPPIHLQAVAGMLRLALAKLDTDDRVMVEWRGDAESPETVTKFELRDHKLLIEFAHPPGGLAV